MRENVFYFSAETRSFPNLCSEQSHKDASQLISPFFHQEMLEMRQKDDMFGTTYMYLVSL